MVIERKRSSMIATVWLTVSGGDTTRVSGVWQYEAKTDGQSKCDENFFHGAS